MFNINSKQLDTKIARNVNKRKMRCVRTISIKWFISGRDKTEISAKNEALVDEARMLILNGRIIFRIQIVEILTIAINGFAK